MSKKRSKPEVAEINRKNALNNIEKKLSIILETLEGAQHNGESDTISLDAVRFVDHLPTSLRKFNAWSSEGAPRQMTHLYGNWTRNANQTLKLHKDLHNSAISAVASVEKTLTKQIAPQKAIKVASLKRSLSLANQLREIAEAELVRCKRALTAAEGVIKTLQMRIESERNEAMRQINTLLVQLPGNNVTAIEKKGRKTK